jgi:DNA-binding transcriptional regulator GbsR (MarR family)
MPSKHTTLEPWEYSIIQTFAATGESFGIQRSVAMIYGLLFCSKGPLSMEDVIARLEISKGSASQGLKELTSMGAAKKQPVIGDRKMFYAPERSLKRLGQRFMESRVVPSLRNGDERLEQLSEMIPEGDEYEYARACMDSLSVWHSKSKKLIPMISLILK